MRMLAYSAFFLHQSSETHSFSTFAMLAEPLSIMHINLNNGTYFRYLETARIDWMRSIGFEPEPGGEGMVIVNAFCNFYRQIEYPGNVLLKMYVSDPGRTTFESWGTMAREEAPDVICAAGGATTIWVDFPKQKALALPEWLRELVSE